MEPPLQLPTATTLVPTPHTDGHGARVKQEAPWALSSLPGLVHTHWSRAEPGLWALSKAAVGLCHLVELPCLWHHPLPCWRDGGGLRKQLGWAKPEGKTEIKGGTAVLAKSSEIAVELLTTAKLQLQVAGASLQLLR